MERSPTTQQAAEEEQEQVKVTSESPKKAIFYIYHPSHFLQQLLRSLFSCLGFHEISVTNNEYSKSLNPLSGGADYYSAGCNKPSDQDDVVGPSSPSQPASDPPPSTATDQQIGASALARRRPSGRPGPTPGPGPQTN